MQPLQRFLYPLLPVPSVLQLDGTLQHVEISDALDIGVDEGPHIRQADADGIEDTVLLVQDRLLRDKRQAQSLLYVERSIVGLLHAGQDPEKR